MNEFHKDLQDRGADLDFRKIAKINFDNFYELKERLVAKRKSLCTMSEFARQLNTSEDEIAEFEQYYSDPTISQLQKYALALMMVIKIQAVEFTPDKLRMYKSMKLATSSDQIDSYNSSIEDSRVQLKIENVTA